MKFKLLYIIVLIGFANFSFAQDTGSTLSASDLQPFGRSFIDKDNNLELVSSAVHFQFSFTGRQCSLYALTNSANAHGYLQYELDGVYQKRLKVSGDTAQKIILIAGNGKHTVTIYKATEALTGPVIIQKITGNKLRSMPITPAPVIEFIGNSITCGAAADTSEIKCGAGDYQDQHNAYYAYGPRVARALHVNYIMSSVSGIGMYRTWNMDTPSMPQVYERESFTTSDTMLWNFSKYSPHIVSIALGTNDMSHGDHVHARQPFDSAVFVKDYIKFVMLIKSKYPQATIALLSSPMINGKERILLQNCLTAVKQRIDSLHQNDKPVTLFFFEPMRAGGCGGHPSVADHAILAKELFPFFRKLL